MKKVFYVAAMMASLLLGATSCKDTKTEQQLAGEAPVTITMSTVKANGLSISDGTKVNQLVFTVYDANNNIVQIDGENVTVRDNVTFPTTETLSLVKGQTYKIVFWAQSNQTTAYNIDNFPLVEVDYAGVNNDENRDAFYAVKEFAVSGSQAINVELTRPFAQVNVGVNQEDWDGAVQGGTTIVKSAISFTNAANSINLLDGTVSGSVAVNYTSELIPTEALMVDKDGNGDRESEFKYLSMSYILVDDPTTGAAKATLDAVVVTLTADNGDEIVISEGLTNVPVQRNWRTNILGAMLTSTVQFNISIDPAYFEDERNVYLPEYTALSKAFAQGGNVTVHKDLVFEGQGSLIIPENVEVTLDLTGYKLINSVDLGPAIRNNGKLTIIGGTFDNLAGDNGNSVQPVILNSGDLIIEDGVFGSENTLGNAIENRANGNVTINGGTFNASSRKVRENPYAYVFNHRSAGTMIINDATVNTEANGIFATNFTTGYTTGEMIVNGGTFQLNGAADCPSHYMVYCPKGKITLKGGSYTWYKGAINQAVRIEGTAVVVVEGACQRFGDLAWINY